MKCTLSINVTDTKTSAVGVRGDRIKMKTRSSLIILILSLGAFLFLSTFLTGFPFVFLYNNYLLNNYLSDLKSIKFSPDTHIIGESKRVGLLYGNGNHCDMEVIVLLRSDLDYKQVSQIAGKGITSPFGRESLVNVFYIEEDKIFLVYKENLYELNRNGTGNIFIDNRPSEHTVSPEYKQVRIAEDMISKYKGNNTGYYYAISAFDQENDAINTFDIRCH